MALSKTNTADKFRGQYLDSEEVGGPDWPAIRGATVTPSDSTDLAFVTRALHVGTGGDIAVDFAESGSAIVLKSIASGATLPYRVKRVRATGTTATDIVALA